MRKSFRDAAAVVQWFLQQIRVDHLLIEVFLCEHIWVTVLGAAAAWAMARLLVFDPFIIMRNVPVEYVAEMRSNENAYISNMMRKFVMEKVLVLAYVIVRNPDKDQMVIATRDAKMPTTFDWAHRITDATVFAIWFILVWSVTAVTLVANQRFEMIVGFKAWKKKPVESDNDTKSAKQTSSLEGSAADSATKDQGDGEPNDSNVLMKRLLVVLTACFFTATAMTSFGFTSFKVIHGLHATMITVEGVSLLVRSLYVTYRVAWWHAVRDAAVRESVPFQKRLYTAKRITDVLIHSFSSIQYALYLVVGAVINGKLLALVFAAQLSHHLYRTASNVYDHFCGRETSRFLD
ncbi:unnamed protein product [Heligmosomoides polygyrus]|uniref:Uncharacterized protein n=1 Tax=Heligmosomoides polygyrus TaxID=6339 RepID=A0A3P8AH51_HELPZ|nr:unnamed protein product [Heligmosomoides polygyrus]